MTDTMPATSLIASLTAEARRAAHAHDLDLDLVISGKPRYLIHSIEQIVLSLASHTFLSLDTASDAHHLAVSLTYATDALRVRIEHDAQLPPAEQFLSEDTLVTAYESIGAAEGSLSLSTGRGFGVRLEMSIPYLGETAEIGERNASDEITRQPARRPNIALVPAFVEDLTAQEAACLSLLATGLSNKEIAQKMNLSVGTVKFHLAQIYQKLGVQGRGRGAAVARARELGLIFD